MKATFTLICLALFLSGTALGQSALEVMIKVDQASKALSDSTFSVMGLSTCKFGKTKKRIKCVEQPRIKQIESVQLDTGAGKLDSKALSIILEPASERGIGMLSFSYDDPAKDTQSWLYLSALGKVKRMASGSEEDAEPTAVFGSEFTTEDMETGKVKQYSYKILKKGNYKNRPVWVIESTPTTQRLKKTRYSKTILWIDQERFITLKVQTFDKSGRPYKRMSFSKIKPLAGHWMAHSILIINQQTNRLTQMTMTNVALNVTVDEAFLSQRSLTDFAFREQHLKGLRKQIK